MPDTASPQASVIASGAQPKWEKTFTHPTLGELTFKVAHLPRTKDWLAHESAREQLSPGNPSMLAAAVAAMSTFMQRPVIDEQREEDPDTPGHVSIRQTFYDPMEDEHVDFPMMVWLDFMSWRVKTLGLETLEQVKNSSGATSGSANADSSPAATDSLPPTRP